MGQHESERPDDVRRELQKHLPLLERLPHKAELHVLEISQTPVNELGRRRGCGACQIAFFDQDNLERAPLCIPSDAAAIDASPDDGEIMDWTAQFSSQTFGGMGDRFSASREWRCGCPGNE